MNFKTLYILLKLRPMTRRGKNFIKAKLEAIYINKQNKDFPRQYKLLANRRKFQLLFSF